MTFAPNTLPINLQYIDNIITRIENIDICSELQAAMSDAFAIIQQKLNSIGNASGILYILYELEQVPSDLEEALDWIDNMSKYIKLIIIPYETFITQLAELVA